MMQTLQIRLTRELINEIKILVDLGIYPNVSECVRDAVRMLVTTKENPKGFIPPARSEEVKAIQEKIQEEIKQQIPEEDLKELQNAKGTRDFLPEEQIVIEKITSTLKETFELFGYSPLKTPVIERFDVLSAKYAGGAEILKETFKLKDQGDRDLGLRYDLTVPLARVIGMNPNLKMPFKRYQIGEVFRDGPIGLGRYRQFTQCDIDVVGCKGMKADAEIIAMAYTAFKKLGFEAEIRVNNRKILNGIMESAGVEESKIESAILSIDKLEKVGEESVKKELSEKGISQNSINKILGIISIQGSNEEKILRLNNILKNNQGLTEIEELANILRILEINFKFDISLARGLSYYTGTIYETFLKNSSIKSAVCSGGRYDKIVGGFLGKGEEYPAVGISFGLDRIYDAVIEKEKPKSKTVTKLYMIPIGDTIKESLEIAKKIREAKINLDMDLMTRGISKNLNYANSLGIPYVLFIGEDELKQNKLKLKNMLTGEEKLLSVDELIENLA